jgi:hypothetical protein
VQAVLDKLKLGSGIVAAAALAIGVGVGVFFGRSLPPFLPLFYSLPWGEEQLARPFWLAIPLGLAIVTSLGTLLAARLLKNEPVLAIMTVASGIMVGIILIMGMLRSVMLIV